MYFTEEQARQFLWQRRRDQGLQAQVRAYLGELPAFLAQGPRAVLARQLATPTHEFSRFIQKAEAVGLPPVCPDFTGDKFCSRNPDKLALAKMTFHHGRGRNNGDRNRIHRVIDFDRWDGSPLDRVETRWGEDFIAFHHRLVRRQFPDVEITDNTGWLRRMGGKPALFWPKLLALFICDGILLENFHAKGHETDFTSKIIRPALAEVQSRLGLRPLIVPLVPVEQEREAFWSWYPSDLEGCVVSSLDTLEQPPASIFRPLVRQAGGGAYA
jgi:hypothetical protein